MGPQFINKSVYCGKIQNRTDVLKQQNTYWIPLKAEVADP